MLAAALLLHASAPAAARAQRGYPSLPALPGNAPAPADDDGVREDPKATADALVRALLAGVQDAQQQAAASLQSAQQRAAATIDSAHEQASSALEGAQQRAQQRAASVVEGATGSNAPAITESQATSTQPIYRFVDRSGHVVFTNIEERVPLAQREKSEVDLSHISLHSELGNALRARLEQEHAALSASGYCAELRSALAMPTLQRVWHDYAPLVVCGGLLLAFALYTPFALKRFGGTVWARTLSMAIPTLAVAGMLSYALDQTGKTISGLKDQLEPCVAQTFARAGQGAGGSGGGGLQQQAALVQKLQRLVADHPAAKFKPYEQ